MKEFIEEVAKANIGKVEQDVFLSNYTTYKVGGLARCIVYPKNVDKLVELMKLIQKYQLKFKLLGNGSNLLFSDRKYEHVLIHLSNLDHLYITGRRIVVGAGYSLMRLSREAMKKSLTGLEFAAGIPGTVGGAVFMNAGAYKSDMGYLVSSAKVLTPDLRIIELTNLEMDFHYRSSFFQKHPDYIILEATLKLEYGKKRAIEEVMNERRKRRMETQPLEFPSAGSVFRNPENMPAAGKLIEDAGLKGLTKGGARISPKHANFIINVGGASADDIKSLIEFVQDTVKEHYHITLKVEQEFVNWE